MKKRIYDNISDRATGEKGTVWSVKSSSNMKQIEAAIDEAIDAAGLTTEQVAKMRQDLKAHYLPLFQPYSELIDLPQSAVDAINEGFKKI